MKKLTILAVLVILHSLVLGQGYRIRVKFPSAADSTLILAHYYLENIFPDDTLVADRNGEGVFKGDSLLHQGLYKIYRNASNHFDILLGADQEFGVTGTDFNPLNVHIEGATETEEFLKYMLFIRSLQIRKQELEDARKKASGSETPKISAQIDSLGTELNRYWKKKSAEFPSTFFARFLMSNYVPVPAPEELPSHIAGNDSLLLQYRFNFQKEHFFDHFDVLDERFLYTPLLKPKMETWFNQVLFPAYDSVKPYVIEMIEHVRPSRKVFQYMNSFFLNASINSNIMGMDALFIDLAKKYYLSGEASWVNKASLDKIRENVLFIEQNLIGKIAPELRLESLQGDYVSLHEISSPFTLLIIYEPNCSHCKTIVPQLHRDVYSVFHQKGLEVYAIYSMDNRKEWEDFITAEGLTDWINVWDPRNLSRFKITYDARVTPGVYLLDKNKKIIGKKLSVEQIKKILTHELGGS